MENLFCILQISLYTLARFIFFHFFMRITDIHFLRSVVELAPELSPVKNIKFVPQIFFLGRSNVGKSSLINSLFGRKEMARSSAQAGKTRTINIFSVNERYECFDFPGYGYARGGKQNTERLRDMIVDYLEKNLAHHVRAVVIIDAYVGPTALDEEVLAYLQERKADILIVANKADKTNQSELSATRAKLEALIPAVSYVFYSCHEKKFQEGVLERIFEGL